MKPPTFDTVRMIGLKLAGVEESTSYGTPALKVRGKLFARLKEDRETLVVRTDRDARDELIAAEPDTYYVTDHYLNYPWVLVTVARAPPTRFRDLLHAAWQLASPKRENLEPAAQRAGGDD